VGGLSQICETEPCGMQTRPVICTDPLGNCDLASIPAVERRCSNATCGTWNTGQWSMVSASITHMFYLFYTFTNMCE